MLPPADFSLRFGQASSVSIACTMASMCDLDPIQACDVDEQESSLSGDDTVSSTDLFDDDTVTNGACTESPDITSVYRNMELSHCLFLNSGVR